MEREKELAPSATEEKAETTVPQQIVRHIIPELLYPQEVADIMKVSRWTVYELVKRKKLPAIKIGAGIRIPIKAVMEFIESGGTGVLTGKEA